MRSESRYSPFVLSIANAVGLMQLITPTASSVGKKFLNLGKNLNILDIYVIDRNIELGIAHIRELTDFFKEYPENLKEVLIVSSYNAGTTSVLKWYRSLKTSDPLMFVEGIRYLETYNYTKNVIENRYFYENFILKDF
jgi:soluble lytic murein transglycosylase